MDDFKDRLRAEYIHIDRLRDKLYDFTRTELFSNLPSDDKFMLLAQGGAMSSYINILRARMMRMEIDIPTAQEYGPSSDG
jgi:hypothetical protein